MKKSKKAVIYVRIATSNQDRRSPSLQSQIDTLSALAIELDLEIVKVFEHIGSGDMQLQNALDFCQKNKDIEYLLVTDPHRFARDDQEAINWWVMFENQDVKVQYA